MNSILITLLLLATSCSSFESNGHRKLKADFSYTDISGTYVMEREQKLVKNKLVTRNVLKASGTSPKTVEKSITVSQLGTIKTKQGRALTVRPLASEFVVWLEGKRYSSRMQLNPKNKAMTVQLTSPEEQWQGQREIPFPGGKYFCFYSQLADCLFHNQFLERVKKSKSRLAFFIVWDSWPYTKDLLTGINQQLFAPAFLRYEGEEGKNLRYIVDVDGQIILYHFSKSFDLVKIAWIAQGITVVPPGQETPSEDQ